MTPEFSATIALLDQEDMEAFSERAAIIEFDGKLSRQEAEELALTEITAALMARRYKISATRMRGLLNKARAEL